MHISNINWSWFSVSNVNCYWCSSGDICFCFFIFYANTVLWGSRCKIHSYVAPPNGLSNRTTFRRCLLCPVGPFKKGPIIPKYTGEKEVWGRGVREGVGRGGGGPQIGGPIREEGQTLSFHSGQTQAVPVHFLFHQADHSMTVEQCRAL